MCYPLASLVRHLVPSPAIQNPACPRLEYASPLLKEKWHTNSRTTVANLADPCWIHRPRSWSRLTANNHPVYSAQINFPDSPNQWFDTEELDVCACLSEVIHPKQKITALDTDSHPDLRLPVELSIKSQQAF